MYADERKQEETQARLKEHIREVEASEERRPNESPGLKREVPVSDAVEVPEGATPITLDGEVIGWRG